MPEPKPAPAKVCPECGADLTGRDPWAHALDHWPADIEATEKNAEARRRQAILREMAKSPGA